MRFRLVSLCAGLALSHWPLAYADQLPKIPVLPANPAGITNTAPPVTVAKVTVTAAKLPTPTIAYTSISSVPGASTQPSNRGLANRREQRQGNETSQTDSDRNTEGEQSSQAVGCASSQPVVVGTGNKVRREVDFTVAGYQPIEFERFYNKSLTQPNQLFGSRWSTQFDHKLGFSYAAGGACTVQPGIAGSCNSNLGTADTIGVYQTDGSRITYRWNAAQGRWTDSKPSPIAWLEKLANGNWAWHTEDNGVETFSASGLLLKTTDEHGLGFTLAYDTNNALTSITSSGGRALQLGWSGGKVSSVTDPAGNAYTYSYDSNGYLSQVTMPGNLGVRSYAYKGFYPGAMTGMSINGMPYGAYSYDSSGRVQTSGLVVDSSTLANVDNSSFSYGSDTTTVTNALGASSTYTFAEIHGYRKLVKVERSGVTNCPNAAAQTAYDGNGYEDYRVDWLGNKTDFTYNAKGQLLDVTSGISGNSPQGLSKTVYTWDATNNRITAVANYGGPRT